MVDINGWESVQAKFRPIEAQICLFGLLAY